MSTRVVALSLALLLASCNAENELSLPAPPAGYPTAYATRDCAPADGPAIRVYLAAEPSEALPPPAPFVDLAIWQGVTSVPGRKFEWTGPSSEGFARRCVAADTCEPAAQVIAQFRPLGPDTTVTGTVLLTFADGSVVTGGFNAAWRPNPMLCG
jgi:hypothetical protein